QKLKDRHVLVRYFNAQRLDNKLRVSIGTGEENDQLLSTLVDILKQS
ncbi:MAG: histidinol-phosphate transaminase, partial [Gammaproteobacteria bacterium]|nr:histidinol-phosphate transaminase [Gammaproteobacteria bacterium]